MTVNLNEIISIWYTGGACVCEVRTEFLNKNVPKPQAQIINDRALKHTKGGNEILPADNMACDKFACCYTHTHTHTHTHRIYKILSVPFLQPFAFTTWFISYYRVYWTVKYGSLDGHNPSELPWVCFPNRLFTCTQLDRLYHVTDCTFSTVMFSLIQETYKDLSTLCSSALRKGIPQKYFP